MDTKRGKDLRFNLNSNRAKLKHNVLIFFSKICKVQIPYRYTQIIVFLIVGKLLTYKTNTQRSYTVSSERWTYVSSNSGAFLLFYICICIITLIRRYNGSHGSSSKREFKYIRKFVNVLFAEQIYSYKCNVRQEYCLLLRPIVSSAGRE